MKADSTNTEVASEGSEADTRVTPPPAMAQRDGQSE